MTRGGKRCGNVLTRTRGEGPIKLRIGVKNDLPPTHSQIEGGKIETF